LKEAGMPTLFKGGLVFDGERAPLPGHGVLVDGGRIVRFAPVGEFDGFAGETVDAGGATLMPGLTDCHVHLCLGAEGDPGTAADKLLPGQMTLKALERAQAALAGGVTGLRDCGGKNYLELAVRDACNSGQLIGPSIRCSGRVICMTGGHGNRTGRIADGVDEVIRAVREQIHAGADLIKIMATGGVMTPGVDPEDAHYTAEEMAAGVGEARRFRRTSASHAQGAQGILNAVRAGVDSIEHGIFMTDECVAEMLARGTYLVPTLAAVKNILDAKAHIPAYIVEKAERVAERHKASVRTFYDAGGRIALGTDAGTPFNRHGENARELEYLVEVGVKPLDALRFGTNAAAELTGLAGEGRIAEGAWADLLLVEGDPVVDIRMAARRENHRMVLKRGVRVAGQALAPGFAAPSRMAAF
jgi:imidazolonepropionase-like amidohydrolase